jgi:hypothetical protein
MRQANGRMLIAAAVPFVGVLLHAADAKAQGGSVNAIFESHGLIGIYAVDCGRRASGSNFYYVHRALDDGRVQRDVMSGPNTRDAVLIIDQARDVISDTIYLSGMRDDGQKSESVWRITGNRVDFVEQTIGGKKFIVNSKFVSDGMNVLPMYKCTGGVN